jgi:hypothetical protein
MLLVLCVQVLTSAHDDDPLLMAMPVPLAPRVCAYTGLSQRERTHCTCDAVDADQSGCVGMSAVTAHECNTSTASVPPPCCVCISAGRVTLASSANSSTRWPTAARVAPSALLPYAPLPPERPVNSPAELLACLRKHRYTPLRCAAALRAPRQPSPPAPPPENENCDGTGCIGRTCHYGRGRCAYDQVRGFFCACATGATPLELASAPDCLPAGAAAESAQQAATAE